MTFNFGEIYVQSDGVAVLFSKLLPWLIIYQALRFVFELLENKQI